MKKNMCLVVLMTLCACGSTVPASGIGVDAGVGCESSSECAQPCAVLGYSKAICASEGVCVCIDTSVDAGTLQSQCSAINRASLAKVVIVAIDGLAAYQAPKTPTYDDVQPNSWYYDYVEATAQLGIMDGYIDTSGNLNGKFGPSDLVSRAQAIKVVITAIDGLANYTVPATPTFDDVTRNAWYFDYVEAAVQLGLIDRDKHFFPVDRADVCWVNELMLRVSKLPGDGLAQSNLVVSLSSGTAQSRVLPKGATRVPLAAFCFVAVGRNVQVHSLTVHRGGGGPPSDWESLYIHDAQDDLWNSASFRYKIDPVTSSTTFLFRILVPVGESRCFDLMGDLVANPMASGQHYFYIGSPSDVLATSQMVTGNFPVTGNTFTIGGVTANTLTVSPGSASADPVVNQFDAEISSFQMTAGASSDVVLNRLKLTQAGNLNLLSLGDIRLYRGTDLIAGGNGQVKVQDAVITFTLLAPYVIPAGQSKSFYVVADILTGTPGGTIKLFLEDYDTTGITVVDQQYGVGAQVINGFTEAAAQSLTVN